MTPQVNALLPHPFGNVPSMAPATEFKTAEVRYFWVNTTQFPPPDSPSTAFKPFRVFQDCWGAASSYVTFLFARNELVRISLRFFGDCPTRLRNIQAFADYYSITEVPGTAGSRLRKVLTHDTIQISHSPDGTATSIDVFTNGSPAPEGG